MCKYVQLWVALFLVGCMASCIEAKNKKKKPESPEQEYDEMVYDWTRTLAEVLQVTGQKHYKVKNVPECFNKAIDGYLSTLDPHSNFLSQKAYTDMMKQTSGEFFGAGIIIDATRQKKDSALLVINPLPDGPAEGVGIQALDKIVEIDGEQIEGMTTEEATTKLRGDRDTIVNVKILREGHPDLLSFDITRDVVKEQSSLSFYLPQYNIYYLSLTTFADNSVRQLEKLLKEANNHPYKGLILDLRSNTGGLLSAAVDIASLFLEKDSLVVSTKGKGDCSLEEYCTKKDPIANNTLPIFILVDNYTASAGEICGGSLQIHSQILSDKAHKEEKPQKSQMIFLLGTKTFGKGSVQEIIPISNNSAIKLTTSLYYLPQDTLIQGIGIEPDFVIERTSPPTEKVKWFTQHHGREENLNGYINPHATEKGSKDTKKKEEKKHKKWSERMTEMLNKDNQFKAAVNYINLLDLARKHDSQRISNRAKAIDFLNSHAVTDKEIALEEVK